MSKHATLSFRESHGLPPAAGVAMTEAQALARSRNFALMQVKAMQANATRHLAPHLEIWQIEPLQEALLNAENHLRKEIQNGKTHK